MPRIKKPKSTGEIRKIGGRSATPLPKRKGGKSHSGQAATLPYSATVSGKHDWAQILDEYLKAPDANLKALAAKYGVSYGYLRIRASKERWTYLRAQEQASVLKKKRTEFLNRMAGESMRFDEVSIDTAKVGLSIVTGRLVQISRLFAASGGATEDLIAKVQRGEPLSKADLYSVVNYREIGELAKAAQIFQQIGRTAFGTDVEQLDVHVSGEVEAVVSIGEELGKDDPARLASFLEALERTGITQLNLNEDQDYDIEGELVEEGKAIAATAAAPEKEDGK